MLRYFDLTIWMFIICLLAIKYRVVSIFTFLTANSPKFSLFFRDLGSVAHDSHQRIIQCLHDTSTYAMIILSCWKSEIVSPTHISQPANQPPLNGEYIILWKACFFLRYTKYTGLYYVKCMQIWWWKMFIEFCTL